MKRAASVFCSVIVTLSLITLAVPLRAASVTWGTPTTVTNVNDIDLTGTLVHAGSWGTTNLEVDVGGIETILFEDRPINTTDDEAGVTSNNEQGLNGQYYSGDTGNTDFNAIMDSNAGGMTKILTLKKLVPGTPYQVQLFVSDERANEGLRTQKWSDSATDGAGNESAPVQRNLSPSVIGTFTADATSLIIYGLPVSFPDTILTAYVLRKTAEPAPAVFTDAATDSIVEGVNAMSYTLQTTTMPASNLTVAVAAPAELEVSLDGVAFSLNVAVVLDGVVPAMVYYRAIDDGIVEASEVHSITHAITVGDGGNYPTALVVDPLPITVIDALIPNVGDIAVYNNVGSSQVHLSAENGANPSVVNTFTHTAVAPMSSYALEPDGMGVLLSAGKHLVLYNCRVDHVSGANRAEMLTHLSLEDVTGTNHLAYGRAQGFIRNADGADETVISGGAVLDVTNANAVLRLHTTRSDVNSAKIMQIEPGHTAIQLLKLDDDLDCLRVSRSTDTLGAADTTFAPVTYDSIHAASSGAMSFASGSGDVILIDPGHYLVMANTHLKRTDAREFDTDASSTTRGGYSQQLTLSTTAVEGSKTTTYIRGSQNGEEADDGTLAIGMVFETTAISVMRVEQMKESGVRCNIIGGKTALTVVKLPNTNGLVRLLDTTGQDINQGSNGGDTSPPISVTFAEQLGAVDASFSHSVSNSAVTINQKDTYLFLGAFFSDDDSDLRQVPNQQWSVNGATLGYGESSRYSRNDGVHNNGNWSGFVADLAAGDTVEMTSRRLARAGVVPGHSIGLQGLAVSSLTTNPVLVVNNGLGTGANSSRTITSTHLLTVDSDTTASNLVYTVDSEPTGGTLLRGGIALSTNDTFTQADIDSGDLTFDSGSTLGKGFGFAFTVSDGGSSPALAHFTVKVVEALTIAADSDATDEDTLYTAAGGATNLLANDQGDGLVVTDYDVSSAAGAVVTVSADGFFTYNPDTVMALQLLGAGDVTNDTFTYTVTDGIGTMATATVTLVVSGVEDSFAAVDNDFDIPANRIYEDAGATITADLTANDGIVRTANGTTNEVLLLNYDAAAGTGSHGWKNVGPLGGATMDWILGEGVTLNAVSSSRGGISAAYTWDGSTDATAGFSSGGLDSISEILGDAVTLGNASFELWVKLSADDFTQISSLFETGGGTGTGILVSNGVLQAANALRTAETSYDLLADSLNLFDIGEEPTNEFFQVVLVIDFDNDLNSLYVNGTLVDTAANPATTDWDGGDGSGLGHFRGSAHGGFQTTAAGTAYDTYYHGSIAACRLYGEALSPVDVFQNFQAIDEGGVDLEGDTLSVSGIYDASNNLVAGTGVGVTIASGGTVTLDAVDGSFSYDPTGNATVADLVSGETRTDSFDIQVTDSNGETDDATVTVAIHGVDQAVNDTLTARETAVTTFTASELVGNDQHALGAARSFITLTASAVTTSNVANGVWINTGTSEAAYDAVVNSGILVNPKSGFGAIGAAWQNVGATIASLDPISAADATFEVWFKPGFGSTGKQVLFETGGSGNGMSIVYDADRNDVTCTADCGTDTDANVQLRASATGIRYDEFNQIVVVYDRDNPSTEDALTLHLNNDPSAVFNATPNVAVTNAAGGANDWAGTDGGGIGTVQGTAALDETLAGFNGQIAILRVYTRVLSVAEMAANFDAAVQPIQSVIPASPITTALGALVTLNADGSIAYDASALSTNIPEGEIAQDSFFYEIQDGVGGLSLATVTINVAGVGVFFAADDDVPANEDGPALVFDPRTNDIGGASATIELQRVVASVRADFQIGTTVGQTADFSSTNGWRYMWNAPTDWTGTNSLDGTTGPFGVAANYQLLKWAGSYWSPDGDEDNMNGDPAGWAKLMPDGVGHPGLGSNQNGAITNNLPRGPIAAYTISTNGTYGIADSFLTKRDAAGDPVSALIYVNDTLIDAVSAAKATTVSFDTGLGTLTAGDTIYVAVSPGNTAGNDTFTWDFSIVNLPDAGSLLLDTFGTVTTDGSTITYDPNGQFEVLPVGQSITESFQYTIRDGSNVSYATVVVEVAGDNDAPTGVADVGSTDEDNTGAGTVLGNDTDIDQGDASLGFSVGAVQGATGNVGVAVATDRGGLVTLQGDGSYVYDPNGQFESLSIGDTDTDTFSYAPEDAHGLAATVAATVTVTIAGADDGVIATDNAYELKADATVSGNIITDDTGDGVDVSIDANDTLSVLSVDVSSVQGLLSISAPTFMGTRGTISNLTDAVQTVTFDTVGGRFTDPVVFANPPSYNEGEPSIVLVSNITAATFDIWLKEQPEDGPAGGTDDMDGASHAAESVSWFVLETGQYRLAGGALIEVGKVDTAAIQHDGPGGTSWQTVNFTVAFSNAPVVFNQIQTFSGNANEKKELFGTRMSNPATTNSFQVALEDYEGDSAARTTAETIGWMAIEPGVGTWNGNPFEADMTGAGVKENWYTINFAQDYGAAPDFISSQATIAGVDPTQLRHRNLDNDSVQILGSEDTYLQTEVGHAAERVTYLAVGGSGDLTAYPAGLALGGFTYDPNGVFDELGSGHTGVETFTYTLTDGHGNTDIKTVTITVTDIRNGTLIIVR